MRLSSTARYAIGALVHMAARGEDRAYFSPDISGLLHSLRGSRGGYRLCRPARAISLLEVIEAVDGPIRGEAIPWQGEVDGLDRRLHEVCDRAAAEARQYLRKIHVSDLYAGPVGKLPEVGR